MTRPSDGGLHTSGGVRTWLLLAGAAAVVAVAALAASGGDTSKTIDDRVQETAAGLRCPVCQNLSVADSPSGLAREMRSEIEAELRAGRTEQQVREFFVARYGEWILLEPTRSGLNLVPWLVPVVAVLLGLGIWASVVRRRPGREAEASEPDRRRIERELGALEEAP